MAIWKATYVFAAGRKGWTEAFFVEAGSPDIARVRAFTLAGLRARLLGSGASLVQIVLSLVGSWRTTVAAGVATVGGNPPADDPIKGLRLRLVARAGHGGGGVQRSFLLRALPQGFLPATLDPDWRYSPDMLARVHQFADQLKRDGWLLKGTDKTVPAAGVSGVRFVAAAGGDLLGNPVPGVAVPPGSMLCRLALRNNVQVPLRDPATGRDSRVLVRGVGWSDRQALRQVRLNGEHRVELSGPGEVWVCCDRPGRGDYASGGAVSLRSERYWPIASWSLAGPGVARCGAAPRLLQSGPVEVSEVKPGPFGGPPGAISKGPGNWGNGNVSETITNARELADWVFAGYEEDQQDVTHPIRIAPVQNLPHTWLVGMTGVYRTDTDATDLISAIAAGVGGGLNYSQLIVDAIVKTVPAGDSLFLAGHSLGGLAAQLLPLDPGLRGRNPVTTLVTYGSFQNVSSVPGVRYVMWREPQDLISKVETALQLFVWDAPLPILPVQPSQPGLSALVQHSDYPFAVDLESYNPDGSLKGLGGLRPLMVGPVSEFAAPLPGH